MHRGNLPIKTLFHISGKEDKYDVAVWSVDRDFHYTFFNDIHKKTMMDIWGTEIELGKCIMEYIPDKDYRKNVESAYKALLKEGSHQSNDYFVIESGREIFYENFGSLIHSSDGSINGIIFYSIDITPKKKIQKTIESYVSVLESIMNSPEDIHIVSVNKNFRYIFFNEAHSNLMMEEWGTKPALGQNIIELAPNDLFKESLETFLKEGLNGKISRILYPLVLKNGKELYFEHISTPIYRYDGSISGITIFSINRTKQETAARKVQQALAEKEILLREIHHRVKNNLQLVSSIICFQMNKFKNPELSLILKDALNRIDIIGKIHQSLYTGRDISSINMKEYCHRMIDSILDLYNRDDLNIKTEIDIPEIFLDIKKAIPISLIMNELITNSFKYAFEGNNEGTISITLEEKGNEELHLRVKDDGHGMIKKEVTTDAKSIGTELIDLFVQQLNGTIEYKNDPGLTVDLYFYKT